MNKGYLATGSLVKVWIAFIFIVTGLVVVLFTRFMFVEYYQTEGVVIEDDLLAILVNYQDADKVIFQKKLEIKGKEFAYKIDKVGEIQEGTPFYQEIVLKIDLEENLNQQNNVLTIQIPQQKKTILKYIIHKIGGN